MKNLLVLTLLAALISPAFSQTNKQLPAPSGKVYTPEQLHVTWPGKAQVPTVENPFGVPAVVRQVLPALQPVAKSAASVRITRADNGLPILFQGRTAASGTLADTRPLAGRVLDYVAGLHPAAIVDPAAEFSVSAVTTDEQGNHHVRLQQVWQGVPVYGSEVIAHTQQGAFELLNGRYYPTPRLTSIAPGINAAAAIQHVKDAIGPDKIKSNWTPAELQFIDGPPFEATLMIYHPNRQLNDERLTWVVTARPTLLTRTVYFIDAQSGALLHHFGRICHINGNINHAEKSGIVETPAASAPWVVNGPVSANGVDLLNVNHSFGAYQIGSQYVLEDASKPMFNAAQSNFPNDPVGVIITLNAQNTSPNDDASFNYDFVVSNSTTFNDKTAVSVHWNSNVSYDYYKNTFNRNSIDGVGGNIVAFANVADDDGSSMGNAYWNGNAMWYGNGDTEFKQLARGLDVGGHEMTHGVIEKTANLEYQDESGALNESFADVFGVLIDRDDWQIGEDVMQPGQSPSGALRSLQDPHNGASSGSDFWQPRTVSEQYTGNADNGGVHINSGIPNWAFYKFASNAAVGKDKAEQVYYKALRDYLVKSSQFVDARIAIIQAANDLYGNAIATIAADAFTAVGITGSQPGGNYLGQLQPNPGDDLILCVDNNLNDLDLAVNNGTVLGTVYNQGIFSRPSVTDDGSAAVFVNDARQLIEIDFTYNTQIQFNVSTLSSETIWRNAAISKDGRYLAALTDDQDNRVYIFDLNNGGGPETFYLYNPTYTPGQVTGDVQFADVMEFDYSGDYLMYDAFNKLENQAGESIDYWDISFLQFRENGQIVDGTNPFISKLFSGLPENTSINNPAFAKNSPYIIAFDYIDEFFDENDIYGANVETGDYDVIVSDNGELGWPTYTRLDNAVLFQGSTSATNLYLQGVQANKISAQGNEAELVDDHEWGVWYGNGLRSLVVGTQEQTTTALRLTVSPNPTTDAVRVSFNSTLAAPMQLTLTNLFGQTLQSRHTETAIGLNSFDLQLQGLPAGTYLVHIQNGNVRALVKVVKQ